MWSGTGLVTKSVEEAGRAQHSNNWNRVLLKHVCSSQNQSGSKRWVFEAFNVGLTQHSSTVTPWSGLPLTLDPMEDRDATGFRVGKYPEIVPGFILG